MLKNIGICMLAAGFFFAGCRKDTKLVFDKPVDERLEEALASYQQKLSGAPGWKVFVYPQGLGSLGIDVGGFSYYMKFTDSNRVTMVSDFDSTMAAVPATSGFRLKALQRPTLMFDTYSYIHVPADPTNSVNNSPSSELGPSYENGFGWGTDFEFAFADNGPSDTIHLKGEYNHSDGVMIRVTQAEMDSVFKKGRLRTLKDSTTAFLDRNNYLYLPLTNGRAVVPSFDRYLKTITFFSISSSGSVTPNTVPFSYTSTGIRLKDSVAYGSYIFQELYWDNASHNYYILQGGRKIALQNATGPILSLNLPSLLGDYYSVISIPPTHLSTQSASFDSVYNAVKASLKTGPNGFELTYIQFVFDATAHTMTMNIYGYPNTNLLTAQYVYNYTTDVSGNFKFTRKSQNSFGTLAAGSLQPLLNYLEKDRFRLEGILTSTSVLGQFTSVEHASFSFGGNLF